jgi:WD40 repeat protein
MRRRQKPKDQHLVFGIVTLAAMLSALARTATADEPASLATNRNWVTALAFSPDGNTLATVGGQTLLYRPGEVKLWDVA